MAGFLYYFPGATRPIVNRSQLPAGLQAVLDANSWDHSQVFNGPSGTSGYCIAIRPSSTSGQTARCGYYPDAQQWFEVTADSSRYWVGFETAAPPRPCDLLRLKTIEGHPVKLADDNEWVIPAVHVNWSTLPRVFGINGSGEVSLEFAPGYEDLMREAELWSDIISNNTNFTKRDWFEYTVRLLAVNYRVGRFEVVLLRLLTDTVAQIGEVLRASLGYPAIEAEIAAQKKIVTPPAG